jgi:hypothetical protein
MKRIFSVLILILILISPRRAAAQEASGSAGSITYSFNYGGTNGTVTIGGQTTLQSNLTINLQTSAGNDMIDFTWANATNASVNQYGHFKAAPGTSNLVQFGQQGNPTNGILMGNSNEVDVINNGQSTLRSSNLNLYMPQLASGGYVAIGAGGLLSSGTPSGGSQTPIVGNVNGAGYTGYGWGTLDMTTGNIGTGNVTNTLNVQGTANINTIGTITNGINVQPVKMFPPAEYVYGSSPTSGSVGTANTLYVCTMRIDWPILITNVTYELITASSSTFAGISIYNTGGTKIMDTGPFATSGSAAVFSVNITNGASGGLTLQPGMYYVGWNDSSVSPAFKTVATTADVASRVNGSTFVNMGTSGTAASSGQNPSSIGTLTGGSVGNIPLLDFE